MENITLILDGFIAGVVYSDSSLNWWKNNIAEYYGVDPEEFVITNDPKFENGEWFAKEEVANG